MLTVKGILESRNVCAFDQYFQKADLLTEIICVDRESAVV